MSVSLQAANGQCGTDRCDGVEQTFPLDEAFGQERDVGAGHLDHIADGNDSEHEAKLETLDDVCAENLEEIFFLKFLEDGFSSQAYQASSEE